MNAGYSPRSAPRSFLYASRDAREFLGGSRSGARALTCPLGASLKCYCPFLHLFYGYFANDAGYVTERAHDCGAFPLAVEIRARPRSRVWGIRFDRVSRVERARRAHRTRSACSLLATRGRSCHASLSRLSPRILIKVSHFGGSARSCDPRMARRPMIARRAQASKERARNANI